MKKIILFVLLCGFITTSFAQEKSVAEKRSEGISKVIGSEMELNAEEISFIQETLLEKYSMLDEKLKDKNLSKEEKKAVKSASKKETNKKLLEKFSKKQVNEMSEISKKMNKQFRKNEVEITTKK